MLWHLISVYSGNSFTVLGSHPARLDLIKHNAQTDVENCANFDCAMITIQQLRLFLWLGYSIFIEF